MQHCAYFFRHGESSANAGEATTDVASIGLTPKGVEQAKALGRFFVEAPQKLVVSPFLRARETAAHALAAFPGLTQEVWPIQEFTYLSPQKCAGTTARDRQPWVDEYWNRAEPLYRADAGVESFNDFIGRVDTTLLRMAELIKENRLAVLFGHGIFMNALRWRVGQGQGAVTGEAMRFFREYALSAPLGNGEGFRCVLTAARLRFFAAI